MILSCSRRTDIPAFYSEWLINRLREGKVCVVNPYNPKQISRINISNDVVDCIVFWTKNPEPMIRYLDEIDQFCYKYYFQFTITPYQKELEPNLPDKNDIVETFIDLSKRIGKEKVILRYDPIFITDKYTIDYHVKAFEKLCSKLAPYTKKVIISFVDLYKKNKKNLEISGINEMDEQLVRQVVGKIKTVADKYNLFIETCAERFDLSDFDINHAKCIDGELIEEIIGYKIINKDKRYANREHCGCMQCIDIGQYDTCLNGCKYCYANANQRYVQENYEKHNPNSELLIGEVDEERVNLRKDIKSFRVEIEPDQIEFNQYKNH